MFYDHHSIPGRHAMTYDNLLSNKSTTDFLYLNNIVDAREVFRGSINSQILLMFLQWREAGLVYSCTGTRMKQKETELWSHYSQLCPGKDFTPASWKTGRTWGIFNNLEYLFIFWFCLFGYKKDQAGWLGWKDFIIQSRHGGQLRCKNMLNVNGTINVRQQIV